MRSTLVGSEVAGLCNQNNTLIKLAELNAEPSESSHVRVAVLALAPTDLTVDSLKASALFELLAPPLDMVGLGVVLPQLGTPSTRAGAQAVGCIERKSAIVTNYHREIRSEREFSASPRRIARGRADARVAAEFAPSAIAFRSIDFSSIEGWLLARAATPMLACGPVASYFL
jgi:hypothetical protein